MYVVILQNRNWTLVEISPGKANIWSGKQLALTYVTTFLYFPDLVTVDKFSNHWQTNFQGIYKYNWLYYKAIKLSGIC